MNEKKFEQAWKETKVDESGLLPIMKISLKDLFRKGYEAGTRDKEVDETQV
jgi:hypothetical protein